MPSKTPAASPTSAICNSRSTNRILPHYRVPDGYTHETYLEELAMKGLAARLRERPSIFPSRRSTSFVSIKNSPSFRSMGYAGYFLIVWDIINFARSKGIPVGPGRGSAAGSLMAYALRITDLDPLVYGLLFERFLNPERISLPDIDMDFCMDRRGEVINYVIDKYGNDHVCQIITFGTLGAKAAIRDVGRVMEFPYAEVDKVAKLVPNQLNITLRKLARSGTALERISRHRRENQRTHGGRAFARRIGAPCLYTCGRRRHFARTAHGSCASL